MLVAGREPTMKTEFSATRRLGDRGAHRKMAAQLDGASGKELAGKLQRLARHLEGMWQPEIAQKYERLHLNLSAVSRHNGYIKSARRFWARSPDTMMVCW